MKYITTLLMVLILSSPAFSQIITEEDEFTGEVSHKTVLFDIPSDNSDLIRSQGSFINSEGSYLLGFSVSSGEWQHLMDDKAYFLIDGERKQINSVFKDSETNTSGTSFVLTEIIGFVIDSETFTKISNADDVRFRVGSTVYTLNEKAKRYAYQLVSEVNSN